MKVIEAEKKFTKILASKGGYVKPFRMLREGKSTYTGHLVFK
jgi:hypothetical protein